MEEMEPRRDTFRLIRGAYDVPGEKVSPGVPAVLPPLPEGQENNRLAFARWLVDPEHPLTARVTVNRFWQMYFGTGLVKTAENFGTQGDYPSHPELLDWLATTFIDSGWDVKAMQRAIVTSATYRQLSTVTPALLEQDPENRLLARGPRLRLPAQMISATRRSHSPGCSSTRSEGLRSSHTSRRACGPRPARPTRSLKETTCTAAASTRTGSERSGRLRCWRSIRRRVRPVSSA